LKVAKLGFSGVIETENEVYGTVWGYLPLKYFWWIFPLTEEKGLGDFSSVIDTVEIVSAVSMTPWKSFQWCY
jgi:hypothetical protein